MAGRKRLVCYQHRDFDPLKYDPKRFFLDKPRNPYTGKSLQKMINIIKDLSRTFAKKKYELLPKVEDLDELTLKAISRKKDRSGTRKEYALEKDEFDTVFHHKILAKDLSIYQSIFNEVNGTQSVPISVDQLITAKTLLSVRLCSVVFVVGMI